MKVYNFNGNMKIYQNDKNCKTQPNLKPKLAELVLISPDKDTTRPTNPIRNSSFQSEFDTSHKEKVVS